MTISKEDQYRQLVTDVKASYPLYDDVCEHSEKELYWCKDCKEINLWSYWQGSLDADILLVGQDWGNPWDTSCESLMAKIRDADHAPILDYMNGNTNPTDCNLVELFHGIGYDITKPNDKTFFTNFALGYRTGKISGGFRKKWADHDSAFFPRLVEIIKPKVILCLGRDTYEAVIESLKIPLPTAIASYNAFMESTYNPHTYTLDNGHLSYVFALAHCGSYGTMNRNRGNALPNGDLLYLQRRDWDNVKRYLQLSRNFEAAIDLSETINTLPLCPASEKNCNQDSLVWFGISQLMQEIMKEAGAVSAIYESNVLQNNEFIRISLECIERQLLLNLAKLFDKSRVCGQLNCSLPNLLELCIADQDHFPAGTTDPAVLNLKETIDLSEQLIPRGVRNKKMAHFDLLGLFAGNEVKICYSDIEIMLLSLVKSLNLIGIRLMGIDQQFPSLDQYIKVYRKQIQLLDSSTADQ